MILLFILRCLLSQSYINSSSCYDREGCRQASFPPSVKHSASSIRRRVPRSEFSKADLSTATAPSGAFSRKKPARAIAASSLTGRWSSSRRSIRAGTALLSPMSPTSFAASARRSTLGSTSSPSQNLLTLIVLKSSSSASPLNLTIDSETLPLLKLSSRIFIRSGNALRSLNAASASAAPTR